MKHNFKQTALKLAIVSAFSIAAAGLSINSYAATETADVAVTAVIVAHCAITTTAVSFGNYANQAENLDSNGEVNTTCTTGTAAGYVTLSRGNFDAMGTEAVPLRRMQSGSDFLAYHLYSNNVGGTVWGNTSETGKATVTGTGTSTTLVVYGRVPLGQAKPVGSYADVVAATVTF